MLPPVIDKPRAQHTVTDKAPLVKRSSDTVLAGLILLGMAVALLMIAIAVARS